MYRVWIYTFDGTVGQFSQLLQTEEEAYALIESLMQGQDRPRFGWVQKVSDDGISG